MSVETHHHAGRGITMYDSVATIDLSSSQTIRGGNVAFVESGGNVSNALLAELGIPTPPVESSHRVTNMDRAVAVLGAIGLAAVAEGLDAPAIVDGAIAFTTYVGTMRVIAARRRAIFGEPRPLEETQDAPLGPKIILPRKPITLFVQGEKARAFAEAEFDPGYEGISVRGASVLKWLEEYHGVSRKMFFDKDGFRPSPENPFLVRNTASLYQLYKQSSYLGGQPDRERESEIAREFAETAKKYAELGLIALQKASLQLPPSAIDYSNRFGAFRRGLATAADRLIDKLEDSTIRHKGWEDAIGTLVSINPAEFMRAMLRADEDPAGLLSAASEPLEQYTSLEEEFVGLCEREWELRQLDTLTGTTSHQHSREMLDIKRTQENNTNNRQLSLMNVAAIAMVRERKQQLSKQHESLLAAMAGSHTSRDLQGILALYEIAITAVASVDTDIEPDTGLNNELTKYLASAAKLADGSEETLKRLLIGMQKRFPELAIPTSI
jgi:hypothetical protein